MKFEQYRTSLKPYLPEAFVDVIIQLLQDYPVRFKIVRPRKTKLGDFRFGKNNEKPQITVNGNLNPYAFLITTIHEFAHLIAFQEFGRRISPHGKEWKACYAKLLAPVIESPDLPNDIRAALQNSIRKIKASSCADVPLQRVLLRYDSHKDNLTSLENIDKNRIFALDNRLFRKGDLRRTRYMCTDIKTGKKYLVSAIAQVELTEHEQ